MKRADVRVEGNIDADEWYILEDALRGNMSQSYIERLQPEIKRILEQITYRKEVEARELERGDVIERGDMLAIVHKFWKHENTGEYWLDIYTAKGFGTTISVATPQETFTIRNKRGGDE